VREGERSVLVLSHLYPSARHRYLGIFVARQVRALAETHEIRVVAPTRWLPPLTRAWRNERSLPRKEIVDGTPVYRPRTPQLPFGLMTAEALAYPVALKGRVRSLEREREIDLVHAHFGLPDGWGAARIVRRLRVPLVVSLWGSDVLVFPQRRTLRRLLSHGLTRAAEVIAPSRPIADRAVELGADPDRTAVVMGGVPDDYCPASRADSRALLGLSPDIRLVVWVGGLVPVKQPLLALRAISAVAARDPDARLAIVGDGPMMSKVRETIRELRLEPVVSVLGALDSAEVAVWQAAADVVLNTSRSEGLPFALSEALVSGTRVAAPPVGGIPELLAATSGGTLSADWSPEAVADAIEHELRLPPDRDLSQRAAFLRLSNVAPRIADIYARALRS
jgi:glycosyltransferase involved in cell wall biosynthesis